MKIHALRQGYPPVREPEWPLGGPEFALAKEPLAGSLVGTDGDDLGHWAAAVGDRYWPTGLRHLGDDASRTLVEFT